jgi:hypothetical protein
MALKMSTITRIVTVFIVFPAAFGFAVLAGRETGISKEALRDSFVSSQSEREKLELAIKIIDFNRLHRYSTLAEFDDAFGSNLNAKRERLGRWEKATAVIYLREQVGSTSDEFAADYEGGIS